MSHGSSSSDPLGIAMPAGALGSIDSSFDYTNSSGESNEDANYGPRGRATLAAAVRHTLPWQPLGKQLTPIAASPSRGESRSGSAPPRKGSNLYALASEIDTKMLSARGSADAPPTGKQKRGTSRNLSSDRKPGVSGAGDGGAVVGGSKMFDVQPALENAPAVQATEEDEKSAKKPKEEYNTITPSWHVLTMSGSSLEHLPQDPNAVMGGF